MPIEPYVSPQPGWVYEIGTLRFLEVNEAATRRYGYSRGEFLAMAGLGMSPLLVQPALGLVGNRYGVRAALAVGAVLLVLGLVRGADSATRAEVRLAAGLVGRPRRPRARRRRLARR